jgi:hypothetical protein
MNKSFFLEFKTEIQSIQEVTRYEKFRSVLSQKLSEIRKPKVIPRPSYFNVAGIEIYANHKNKPKQRQE